jgi:hypothetical protein
MSRIQPRSEQRQEQYISLEMSPYDQAPPKPTHKPTIPARLDRLHRQSWGLAIAYILSALSPVVFFVVGVLAFSLHGKPLSEWGSHIQKVILLVRAGQCIFGIRALLTFIQVPSVFPVVFAALIAHALRAIALRLSERGTTIGRLEQACLPQSSSLL